MINASIYLHLQTVHNCSRTQHFSVAVGVTRYSTQSEIWEGRLQSVTRLKLAWGLWARSSSNCQGEARNWKTTTQNKTLEKSPSNYDSTNLLSGFWSGLVSVIFVVEGIFTPRFSFSLSSVFSLCLLQDRPLCIPWFWRLCRLQLSNYQVAVVMIKPRDGAQIIDNIACKCMWRSSIHIFRQWYAVL